MAKINPDLEWFGMHPAEAYFYINRHSDNWEEAGHMMQLWHEANLQNTHLKDALRKIGANNAWRNFGECRVFGDLPENHLTPAEIDALCRLAL